MTVKTEKQMAPEHIFELNQRIVFLTTLPLKLSLSEVAKRNQLSISDVIRIIINDYASTAFPEYKEIYAGQLERLYLKE